MLISDTEEILLKLLKTISRCVQALEAEGLLYERDLLLAPLAATFKPPECSLLFSLSEFEIMDLNKRTANCEQLISFVLQHRHPNISDPSSTEASQISPLSTQPSSPPLNNANHHSDEPGLYSAHQFPSSVNSLNGETNLLSNDTSGPSNTHSLLRSRKRMCKVTGRSMHEEKELAFSYFLRPDLADKDIMQVYLQYKRELGGGEHAKCPISRAEFYRIAPEAKKRKLKEQGRSTCEHCHKETSYTKAEVSPSIHPKRPMSSRKKRNANNDKTREDRMSIDGPNGDSRSASNKHSHPSKSHTHPQPTMSEELQSLLPRPLTSRAPPPFNHMRDINESVVTQSIRNSLTTSQSLNHFPTHSTAAPTAIIRTQPSLSHHHARSHSHMQTDCQDAIGTDHGTQLIRPHESSSISPRPLTSNFPIPPPPYYFPWSFTSTPSIRPSILLRPRPALGPLHLCDSGDESEISKSVLEDGRFTAQSNPVCIGEDG
jgi:hypothetical protein